MATVQTDSKISQYAWEYELTNPMMDRATQELMDRRDEYEHMFYQDAEQMMDALSALSDGVINMERDFYIGYWYDGEYEEGRYNGFDDRLTNLCKAQFKCDLHNGIHTDRKNCMDFLRTYLKDSDGIEEYIDEQFNEYEQNRYR